jgi:DNA polymerase III subunit delta
VIHLFVGSPPWSRPVAEKLVASLVGEPNPLNPVMLSEDQLRADPSALLTEISTVPMFGDRPVVWVRAGGGVLCRQVEDLLDASLPEGAGVLVAEIEALPAQSTLTGRRRDGRLSVTMEPALAPADIVAGFAAAHGLRLDAGAVDRLLELCGGERGLAESELSKLAAYAGPESTSAITAETILALCGDASQITAEDMVATALAGGASQVGLALLRSRESGATGHQLASGVVQRVFRDLRVRPDRSGRPAPGMAGEDLAVLALEVFDMIRDTRLSSGFDQEIAERFLLKMAISRARLA